MSDVGIGPLNITRPERVGTLTIVVEMTGAGKPGMGEADARNLTDPVLSVVESNLRDTSMGKPNLDPVAWSENHRVYVNTKKRSIGTDTVDRVVNAIEDAIDEAYPGVTDAAPPKTGAVRIRSEFPVGDGPGGQ